MALYIGNKKVCPTITIKGQNQDIPRVIENGIYNYR